MEEKSYIYIEPRSRSSSPAAQAQDTPNVYLKQFITTYESLPSLWDRTNPNYLNKRKRHEDLDSLARILRNLKPYATREDARKKVNSLRSNYRKELVKIQRSKRSGGDVYKPTSSTFYMLRFLEKIEEAALRQRDSDEDEEKINNSTAYHNEEPLSKRRRILRKRKRVKQAEVTPKPCPMIQQPMPPTQPIVDIVEPIVLVWSEKIKNLGPTQRLHVEKAINDILYEAELQNLSETLNRAASPTLSFTSSHLGDKIKADLVISKEERIEC